MKAKPERQEISRKVDKYWVPIIAKTIELLDCFGSATESLTLEEVVKRTGIPHTTAYRILHTLVLRDTSPSPDASTVSTGCAGGCASASPTFPSTFV